MNGRTNPDLPGYRILKHLGTGAHAVIHLGVQVESGEKVAIKRIVRRGPDDDKFLVQAENEFAIAGSLNHPALRRCLDLIRVRKWLKTRALYLVMEYAEGDTLEHHPPSRLGRVPAMFINVAEGLHAMHLQGYVHTDIKPNNIVLHTHDRVKIIDFGQSCRLGHAKQRVQGTPDYMAPEQVRRQPLDQRTDVFNLGATMYWVVTRRAFSTAMPTQVDKNKLIDLASSRRNPPPEELNPKVHSLLSKLIMRCCEDNPTKRPRDMREVIGSLELVDHKMGGRPPQAAPVIESDRA
jgi:serine/threonine-protein kinase